MKHECPLGFKATGHDDSKENLDTFGTISSSSNSLGFRQEKY